MGRLCKERFGTIWFEKRGHIQFKRNRKSELEQKLITPANQDNGIKMGVFVVVVVVCERYLLATKIISSGSGNTHFNPTTVFSHFKQDNMVSTVKI